MTHTRTYTYEERAMELALAASDPDLTEPRREKAVQELRDWVSKMPEESWQRVLGAAQGLVASAL